MSLGTVPLPKHLIVAVLAAVASVIVLGYGAPTTSATVVCDRYAATSGSDGSVGTSSAPYRTAQKLIDSLSAGQTGCLLTGTYDESLRFNHGGTPGTPIRLTSAPGNRATVVGRMFVPDGSSDVVVADLTLDGRNASALPSPSIAGDRVMFSNDDVSNGHTGICFTIGSALGWGVAENTVLDGNRIHDCGRLPSTNHDHGIYVEASRNAVITNNYIYANADRGIQLYPDAQGTTVANNLIDGNGEGVSFGGDSGWASSNTTVVNNVITNSVDRANVESWWPAGNPVGTGNVVTSNCVWNGAAGNIDSSGGGFTASANTVANPQFANRTARDYTLSSGSPCAGDGPATSAAGGTPPPPTPPPPPPPASPIAPTNVQLPAITGTAKAGQTLSVGTGTWNGTTPVTYTYSWQRCSNTGAGCTATAATGRTYGLTASDVGLTLRVVVTALNAAGSGTATSRVSGVITSAKKKRASSLSAVRSTSAPRRAMLRSR